jgi:hypothetical protein
VGYVQAEVASASPLREAFFAGLRELEWVAGRNITIDWRRRDEEIADLAGLNPAAVIRRPHQLRGVPSVEWPPWRIRGASLRRVDPRGSGRRASTTKTASISR